LHDPILTESAQKKPASTFRSTFRNQTTTASASLISKDFKSEGLFTQIRKINMDLLTSGKFTKKKEISTAVTNGIALLKDASPQGIKGVQKSSTRTSKIIEGRFTDQQSPK
jgi:hypothetical protein